MASMRGEATKSYGDKMGRMGLKIRTAEMGEDEGDGHALPAMDGTQGIASGGRAEGYASEAENESTMAAKRGKPRLDRPGYKSGGRVKKAATTVNVIIAPQGGEKPMNPPMPMPPPGAMPMPPPGGGGGPPMPMGGPPMPRKKGGRVPMDAGAGGGLGRLEKIKAYGGNAKK